MVEEKKVKAVKKEKVVRVKEKSDKQVAEVKKPVSKPVEKLEEKKQVVGEAQVSGESEKDIEQKMNEMGLIKHALITEKSVNMIDAENKIVFIVDSNANKIKTKKAVEDLYKVKVKKVNIIRDQKGRKKAIVSIDKKFKAGDVATKLGVV
jgi:ribosomal protein L23